MKLIAWGNSKILKMYLDNTKNHSFEYCIDNFTNEKEVGGIPIHKAELLMREKMGVYQVVIFAVSNASLQAIFRQLNMLGLRYGKEFVLYSDFFYEEFKRKAESKLRLRLSPDTYKYALSFTMNSRLLIHTTILGTWLFLEIIKAANKIEGQISEVGVFQGGNALCAVNYLANANLNPKKYYLFDSFEGFPKLSKYDPKQFSAGDYKIETTFQEIVDVFSVFPETVIIKGFVPEIFSQLPKNEKYSVVFYDCDLYQPALDTYEYFWDRIQPGGYLIIHDYEAERGGFTGVKKATNEYFGNKDVELFSFPENTMGVVRKA